MTGACPRRWSSSASATIGWISPRDPNVAMTMRPIGSSHRGTSSPGPPYTLARGGPMPRAARVARLLRSLADDSALRARDRRRPEHVVADAIAVADDPDDGAVGSGFRGRHRGYRFVQRGIERLALRFDARDAESLQLRQELPAHDVHALDQRVRRPGATAGAGGVERAIEVVHDVEQLGQDFAAAALDLLGDLAAQPDARLFEFGCRTAVARDRILELRVLLRDLSFELFDVGRLL